MAQQFGGDGFSYFPGQGFQGFDENSMQEFNMAQQQPFLHRASDPLAFMQHSQLARAARDMPLHDLTKPEDNMPWSGQFRAGLQQRHQQFNPQTWQGNVNQRGAKTEPVANQDAYIERHSDPKTSEVSDSAYGSMPTSSGLDNYNSNKTELEQDFQSHYFEPFKVEHSSESLLAIHPDPPRSVKSEGHHLTTQYRDNRRRQQVPCCEHCGKQPKNPSDAKKHELTHIKPYRCKEPNCERLKGFATINDLERHRKSVHSLRPQVGSTAGYVCQACPMPDGGGHRKFWPRKDNFKAHIKRKHPEHNEARLVEVSRQDVRPDDVRTVEDDNKSIRSAMQSSRRSQVDHNEVQGFQMSPNLSRNVSDQADFANSIFPDSAIDMQQDNFAGMGGHATESNMTFSQYTMGPPDSTVADGLDLLGNNNGSYGDSTVSAPSFKKPKLSHDTYSYERNTNPVFQITAPERSATSSSSNTQSSAASSSVQGVFKCPKCDKVKRRDCDLKKHMKRHTRPYGCTFPSCHKKFGSRNDWKRHESSQHFLHEMYKCEAKRHDGTPCVHRPFRDVEALKRHLRGSEHRLQKSDPEIADMCRQYLLGREGHERFWCGFCQKLVSQEKALQNAWDARFKHIGDHFDKEGKDGGDWVCIEENKAKKYIMPPPQEEGKGKERRNISRKEEHEEEADLPEFNPTTEMPAGVPNGFGGMEQYDGGFNYLSASHGRKRKHSAVDADADGESDDEIR